MIDWLKAGLPAGVPAENWPLLRGEEIRKLYSGRQTFADARKHGFPPKISRFRRSRKHGYVVASARSAVVPDAAQNRKNCKQMLAMPILQVGLTKQGDSRN
ncbi:hypothetical protein [Paraburkholderia ultramafica]|uniref:hypothetical protein n=1 Tax=Paraburkholderia ultramafica TaxID=1544867 RepID=UPI001584070C|nr:hypothetical protein [Paraburkholderia ultramafica]